MGSSPMWAKHCLSSMDSRIELMTCGNAFRWSEALSLSVRHRLSIMKSSTFLNSFFSFKKTFKNFTFLALFHFLFPGSQGIATAFCTINKPAEVAGIKLPGRACLLYFIRTLQNIPAFIRGVPIFIGCLKDQKKQLPFNMVRNFPPALFIAVDCFDGDSK